MKVTRRMEQPISELEEIFCNKCGLSCKSPIGDYYGLIEAEVTAGYNSTHLTDGDVHKFSLCERCLKKLIKSFRYPSLQGNYLDKEVPRAEGFDVHDYWPDDVILSEDPEFHTHMSSLLNDPILDESFDEPQATSSLEDLLRDPDDDDLLDFLPKPIRIKKEDMN